MYAEPGDRLMVASRFVDGPTRDGEILEVPHADGSPPYLVRWSDTGHQSLVFPGPDSRVQHFHHEPQQTPVGGEKGGGRRSVGRRPSLEQ